jgi:hypothetical protein
MSLRRRLVGFVAVTGSAVAVTGAVSFACITPASVNLSTASGKVGDVLTVTGSSFSMPANATTGVQIRWKSPEGPLLSEVRPDDAGNFKTTITIPDGPPGYYVITAVLKDASGNDVPGTPGRALFEVRTEAAAPAPEPAAPTFTPSAGSDGSTFPLALVIGLGVVGLVLFAGGFLAVARFRRSSAPAPSPVRRD